MKSLNTKLLLSLVAFFALFIISCEGPEGPAGPAGPAGPSGQDGADGKDAAVNCQLCHNATTELKGKMLEYMESTHYLGEAYVRGSSAGCATCHANEGFVQHAAGEEVTGAKSPTPVGCRTCHTIHEDYALSDYGLRTTADVTLAGDLTGNQVVSLGEGNLCANCHQTRSRNYGLEVGGSGDIEINSSHWGPHYGTQTNMLVGKGGFEVPGTATYAQSMHQSGVANTCVACHVTNGSHTFEPKIGACTTCHADAKDFDVNGFQTEIAVLIKDLEDLLVAEGLIERDDETGEVHPHTGTLTTHNKAGALHNYYLAKNDGSYGVHNPKYTKALLQNSIEVFE